MLNDLYMSYHNQYVLGPVNTSLVVADVGRLHGAPSALLDNIMVTAAAIKLGSL
jgi:hypothetical protein